MKHPAAICAWILIGLLAGAARADGDPARLDEVERSLKQAGPRATLQKYFNCEKRGAAYQGIASGDARWLRLAENILPDSDACYTEGIQDSLGRAMRRAPRRVLPLVDRTPLLAADRICLPFISNEIPVASQRAEIDRSRRSIRAVDQQDLAAQKERCLGFIQSVEAGLASAASAKPGR